MHVLPIIYYSLSHNVGWDISDSKTLNADLWSAPSAKIPRCFRWLTNLIPVYSQENNTRYPIWFSFSLSFILRFFSLVLLRDKWDNDRQNYQCEMVLLLNNIWDGRFINIFLIYISPQFRWREKNRLPKFSYLCWIEVAFVLRVWDSHWRNSFDVNNDL